MFELPAHAMALRGRLKTWYHGALSAGPDEYHYGINNSAYTNAGVIQSLRTAALVAKQLGLDPSVYAAWEAAAASITMPWDAERQYHPE